MSDTKKLTTEELEKLRELQNSYSELTIKMGQLSMEKIVIQQQLDRLSTLEATYSQEYSNLLNAENNLLKELDTKYGAVTVNLDTGEIS